MAPSLNARSLGGMLVGLCVVLIALWPPWIITSRTLFLPHNGFHSAVNENVQHRFEEKFYLN
jgi:hypothetical protein